MSENSTYRRGSRVQRITTAALRPGHRCLTEDVIEHRVRRAHSKTGSIIRTVERVEPFVPSEQWVREFNAGRRQGGRRTVIFTDGTTAYNLAAHETWPVLASLQEEGMLRPGKPPVYVLFQTDGLPVLASLQEA